VTPIFARTLFAHVWEPKSFALKELRVLTHASVGSSAHKTGTGWRKPQSTFL
jgi:hypothetical protein